MTPDESAAAADAPQVDHVRVRGGSWSRRRRFLAIGSSVAGVGMIVFGAITSNTGDVTAVTDAPVTTYADPVRPTETSKVPVGESLTVDRPADVDPDSRERADDPQTDGGLPGTDRPAEPGTDPTTSIPATPDTTTPGTPAAPGTPDGPGTPAPGIPAPTTPVPPAPPAAPQPLAFGGLVENETVGLLGIRILSSYTLSLSGRPGATASVTYGAADAGSVTFDGAGRASITLGGALIDLGLHDPLIRVAYTDGTAGSPIEGRRDSL